MASAFEVGASFGRGELNLTRLGFVGLASCNFAQGFQPVAVGSNIASRFVTSSFTLPLPHSPTALTNSTAR